MRLFMRDDIFLVFLCQTKRQIDAGTYESKHKGRYSAFALPDRNPHRTDHTFLKQHRSLNASAQTPVADRRVQYHQNDTCDPTDRSDEKSDLQRVCALLRAGGKCLHDHRIDSAVDGSDPTVDPRSLHIHNIRADGLRTWNQAKDALDRYRHHQPQCSDPPQREHQLPWRSAQQKPEDHHREHQPSCRDPHVDRFQENISHLLPPFRHDPDYCDR